MSGVNAQLSCGPARHRIRRSPAHGHAQVERDASYAGFFEPEHAEVDWTRPAEDVHRQVRAWWVAAARDGVRGPLAELGGERAYVVRTRLDAAEGGILVECGDGAIWVLERHPPRSRPAPEQVERGAMTETDGVPPETSYTRSGDVSIAYQMVSCGMRRLGRRDRRPFRLFLRGQVEARIDEIRRRWGEPGFLEEAVTSLARAPNRSRR